jgi:hypothetical protein
MKKRTKSTADKPARTSLRQQVLLAALDCSKGDLKRTFTAEDLLLSAWKRDPMAWGLRGHERQHPDSEKIYTTLDRTSVPGGFVGMGLFEKTRQRTYRFTAAGLLAASEVDGADPGTQGKAERALSDAVSEIISHPVLRDWMRDPSTPKSFRDAGHFWGIAPGTPPRVIRSRIQDVDRTLDEARSLLSEKSTDHIAARHGKTLFDKTDIIRAMEFQTELKRRFEKDLAILQVTLGTDEELKP